MDNANEDILLKQLTYALGPDISRFLLDDQVIELMLNPDTTLWVENLGEECKDSGFKIAPEMSRQVIELIATSTKTTCDNKEKAIISAELPGLGHRFEGILPPVTENPIFVIRKKAIMVYSLSDYVKDQIITEEQKKVIINAVNSKKNILVAGGTGSGKTTLLNAILAEMAMTNDRVITIEDTRELQCNAKNKVQLRSNNHISMNNCLKSVMRQRPDRIIVGEVRGPEALDLLKSWNTGHPGGIASLHANSCKGALTRIESLVGEATLTPQKELIAESINFIIYIERYQKGRRIKEIVSVEGVSNGEYILKQI